MASTTNRSDPRKCSNFTEANHDSAKKVVPEHRGLLRGCGPRIVRCLTAVADDTRDRFAISELNSFKCANVGADAVGTLAPHADRLDLPADAAIAGRNRRERSCAPKSYSRPTVFARGHCRTCRPAWDDEPVAVSGIALAPGGNMAVAGPSLPGPMVRVACLTLARLLTTASATTLWPWPVRSGHGIRSGGDGLPGARDAGHSPLPGRPERREKRSRFDPGGSAARGHRSR